jgi:ferrous iron transport protein A
MADPGKPVLTLSDLERGARGVVLAVADDGMIMGDAAQATVARRLRELGFVPGASLTVLARMWPGNEPIAVRVAGATFALRRFEADKVQVSVEPRA